MGVFEAHVGEWVRFLQISLQVVSPKPLCNTTPLWFRITGMFGSIRADFRNGFSIVIRVCKCWASARQVSSLFKNLQHLRPQLSLCHSSWKVVCKHLWWWYTAIQNKGHSGTNYFLHQLGQASTRLIAARGTFPPSSTLAVNRCNSLRKTQRLQHQFHSLHFVHGLPSDSVHPNGKNTSKIWRIYNSVQLAKTAEFIV